MDLLFDSVRKPYVLPGAGCIETIIYNKMSKVDTNGFLNGLQHLIFATLQENPMTIDLLTDNVYGHLWKDSSAVHCQCGLISNSKVEKFLAFPQNNVVLDVRPLEEWPNKHASRLVLDHFQSKLTMFCAAMEAASSFSSVGKIVILQ